MNLKLGALLLAMPLFAASAAVTSHAGETAYAAASVAPARAAGANACCAFVTAGESVVLERAAVKMDIESLPALGEDDPLADYGAYVQTEYSLYNPADEAVQMQFLLPVYRPEYLAAGQTPSCELTLDGAPLERRVRHCFAGYYDPEPDPESGAERIKGTFDAIYCAEELIVREYRFSVSVPESVKGTDDFMLMLGLSCNPLRTRIVSDRGMRSHTENGDIWIYFDVERTDSFSLYAVGEPPRFLQTAVCSSAGYPLSEARADCTQTDYPYRTFALRDYDASSGISEEDWQNGFSQMLSENTGSGYLVYVSPTLTAENFMRWYEYGFEIPAGERVTHTVKTPIYPTCIGNSAYEYEYLLSPAFRFSSFGELSVDIRTPYSCRRGTLDLQTEEGGYALTRDSLPMCELSFTLERAPSDAPRPAGLSPSVKLAIIILSAVVGAVGIGAAAYFVTARRKRPRGGKKE